ncbi:MAG: DUF6338 family protein [Gemmatimonadota bacterium]|nr:DUF6338 family protein [Gemmatimonadota bacterium]
MGFGSFFVVILGGYIFVRRCHWLRLIRPKTAGHHVLLRASVAGGLLLALAFVFELVIVDPLRLDRWLTDDVLPNRSEATVAQLLTLPLAALLAFVANCLFPESWVEQRAIERANESLEQLFYQVASEDSEYLLEVTLASHKVYVGWVLGRRAIFDRKYLELLPLKSGYRRKEQMKVEFTTDYANTLDALGETDVHEDRTEQNWFRIVIPLSQIVSARPFRIDVYEAFQEVPSVLVAHDDF